MICDMDDILVATKEEASNHNAQVEKVRQKLDEEGWAIKNSRCNFFVNHFI